MEPRGPVVLLEEGRDEGAGVLVVDDGDDELHGREYTQADRPSDTGIMASVVGRDSVRRSHGGTLRT